MAQHNTDWIKIRNEYINGNISYRKLAEKHGVSFSTMQGKAREEKWFEKRKAQRDKIEEKTIQKTAELLAQREADRLLRISNAADRLLEKIEEATEQLDQFIITNKVKQKEVKYVSDKAGFGKPEKEIVKEVEDKRVVKADHLDRLGLKQLTSALKDLRDIQFVKDEQEQEQDAVVNINIRAATPADMDVEEE